MTGKSGKGGRKSQKHRGKLFFFPLGMMSPYNFFCFPWTLHSHSSWIPHLPHSAQTHTRWTKACIPIFWLLFFSMILSYKGEEKNRTLVMLKIKKIPTCLLSGRVNEALSSTRLSLFFCLSPQNLAHIPYASHLRNKQHLVWLVHINACDDWPAGCHQRECATAKQQMLFHCDLKGGSGEEREVVSIRLPVF